MQSWCLAVNSSAQALVAGESDGYYIHRENAVTEIRYFLCYAFMSKATCEHVKHVLLTGTCQVYGIWFLSYISIMSSLWWWFMKFCECFLFRGLIRCKDCIIAITLQWILKRTQIDSPLPISLSLITLTELYERSKMDFYRPRYKHITGQR